MTPDHDTGDDREFDDFLRGEDELSALLAGVEQPRAPAELDARILAQAREALGEQAAANDGGKPAPRGAWLWRARAPLALAATVVLGVSLGLRWEGWRGEEAVTVSDVPPAAPAPQAEPAPKAPPVAQPPRVKEAPMPLPPPPPVPAPVRRHAQPADRKPAAVAPAAPALLPPPAPNAPPTPASALTTSHYQRATDSIVAEDVGALPDMPVVSALRARAAPPATPAPAMLEKPGAEPAQPHPADPRAEQWLALITGLLDRGLDADARLAWPQFRAEFPNYPVPPALQARVDALQGRQPR